MSIFTMPSQVMACEGMCYMLASNSDLHDMSYMGMPCMSTISIYHVDRNSVLHIKRAPYSLDTRTFPVDSSKQMLYDVG